MGCYINPPDMTKEAWLEKYGTKVEPTAGCTKAKDLWAIKPEGTLPVILVNNLSLGFTAAGVIYDEKEGARFLDRPDDRPKVVYFCKIEDLKQEGLVDRPDLLEEAK